MQRFQKLPNDRATGDRADKWCGDGPARDLSNTARIDAGVREGSVRAVSGHLVCLNHIGPKFFSR